MPDLIVGGDSKRLYPCEARFCLSCGHVMYFLRPDDVAAAVALDRA